MKSNQHRIRYVHVHTFIIYIYVKHNGYDDADATNHDASPLFRSLQFTIKLSENEK